MSKTVTKADFARLIYALEAVVAVGTVYDVQRARAAVIAAYAQVAAEMLDYHEQLFKEIDTTNSLRAALATAQAALKKAKPIVGSACAAAGATGSNDTRRLREKVYEEICAAIAQAGQKGERG